MTTEMNFNQWGVTPMTYSEMQEVDGGFLKGLWHALKVAGKWIWEHLDKEATAADLVLTVKKIAE